MTEEPNSPLSTGPRTCCLPSTLWRGEEGQRCTSSPDGFWFIFFLLQKQKASLTLYKTEAWLPALLPRLTKGIPMPSSALSQNRGDFQGSAAVSDTLTVHTLRNRNAVNWKREGLAHEAGPQFTQLSKCPVKILVLGVIVLLRRQSASGFASASSKVVI